MLANAWNSRLIIIGVDKPFTIVSISKLINTFAKRDFVVTGLQTACLSVYFTLQDPMRSQMPDSIRWTTLQLFPSISLPSYYRLQMFQVSKSLNNIRYWTFFLSSLASAYLTFYMNFTLASYPKNTLHFVSKLIKQYSPKEIDGCLDCEKRVNFSSVLRDYKKVLQFWAPFMTEILVSVLEVPWHI